MQKKLVIVCLLNFLVAALMGLALRYSFIESIGLNYRYLTHAHSHVAMLGWVYLMMFVCIVHYFIPEKKPIYNRLFWLTQFAVIGMMLSFPFQGYGVVSITFSTLHILCSYYFAYLIWKHHKTTSKATALLLKASLLFMLLSTLGVWCLGPAVGLMGKASAFYEIAIQFFLHFQFNGWFLISAIAILFHLLNIEYSKTFKHFFYLLIISTILTLALPIQWFVPHNILLWINGIGTIFQLITLFYFLKIFRLNKVVLPKNESKLTYYLLYFAVFCYSLKIVLQGLTLIPELASSAYQHRNFVIGFIHLLMLGVISGFLFSFILKKELVSISRTLYLGIYSFLLGFILTEIVLFIQGYYFYFGKGLLPNYYLLLFIFSILMPLGILLLLLNMTRHKSKPIKKPAQLK